MAKVIAIANQKGGTAKTTTAMNLGAGMARLGRNVLDIDADPQGSLTVCFGYAQPDAMDVTLSTIMEKVINDEWEASINIDYEEGEEDYLQGILQQEDGVSLLPGNIELSGLEVSLVNVMSRETVLSRYINSIRNRFDYILIDCGPSLGMITLNVLSAADSVLIPVQAEYLPMKGLEQLLGTVARVKKHLNPKLEIEGILLTMTKPRTIYGRDIASLVREGYGKRITVFDEDIPASVRATEASALGMSIFRHDPKGKVAKAYSSLVGEVLKRG